MRRFPACLALVLLVGAPGLVSADWLVLEGGEILETKGPWKIEGRGLTYTSMRGQYSLLPLEEVDLEASRRLTEEKLRPLEPEAAPVHREPVLRIVVDREPAAGASRAAPAAPSAGVETELRSSDPVDGRQARLAVEGSVTVVDWRASEAEQGARLVGFLANQGQTPAAKVALVVSLLDEEGRVLGTLPAELGAVALPPGSRLGFTADFPDVLAFTSVRFEVSSLDLAPREETDPGFEILDGLDDEIDAGLDSDPFEPQPPDDAPPEDGA